MKNGFYPSHIELNKTAFQQNLSFIQKFIGEDVIFSSVIKGNAYGHGISQFVPMAEKCGVRHFSVFSSDEALDAFKAKNYDESHIMIMGMIEEGILDWVIQNEISFFVFELQRFKTAIEEAKNLNKPARIHLHLETGMNRLGLDRESLITAVSMIEENPELVEIEGICTHYAGAESVGNHVRVINQIEKFKEQCSWLSDKGIEAKYYHSACSAAALNYPETTMDLVRIGIAQFGFWPNRETYMNFVKNHPNIPEEHQDPLERVLSWKSMVMSTKSVKAGEFVGYGNAYLTSRDEQIATVPIGYAQGFGRNLTNVGFVLINGERAPVAGLVNMNMLTVDVTDIKDVKIGDEVVIIGYQGDKEITVASFSEMANNLNYEVLVRLPAGLPRHITEG